MRPRSGNHCAIASTSTGASDRLSCGGVLLVDGTGGFVVLPKWSYHLRTPNMSLPELTEVEPEPTAIESVFERILADIVKGVHPAGTRLPAERELARLLGASRPTLREALRRLGE